MDPFIVARWVTLFALLTVIGAPIAATVFRDLPGRGGAFALPTALVAVTMTTFWIGRIRFGAGTIVVAFGLTAFASAIAWRFGPSVEPRAVAVGFVVFLVGFGFLLLERSFAPGITPAGGEQFLHFSIVKSLTRAPALPPEDAWFLGEPYKYYYGTQLGVTLLTLLTDTAPRIGYNLGLATFFGLLVVGAYGLCGAMTAEHGRSFRVGGAVGATTVAFGGHLVTPVRLLFGQLPRDLATAYGRPVFGGIRHMEYEEAIARYGTPSEWFWFYERYVTGDTLQEVPLYSFVKADLHGHALSTGYVVLAAAIAYAYVRTPADERWRRRGLLFGCLGLLAGLFGVMNTWSLPTAVGLAWLAATFAPSDPVTLLPAPIVRLRDRSGDDGRGETSLGSRLGSEIRRSFVSAGVAIGVGSVGVALASPFLLSEQVPENGGVGFFPGRTALPEFLLLYGGVAALFSLYVGVRLARNPCEWSRTRVAGLLAGLAIVAVLLIGPLSFPALGVLGPALVGGWVLARTRADRGEPAFETVLLVGGVGLVLSMELVYARVFPFDLPRWNTSLKVAIQAWVLCGLAAGPILTLLGGAAWDALRGREVMRETVAVADRLRLGSPTGGAMVAVVLAVLVVTSGTFGAMTVATTVAEPVLDDAETDLDGLAIHERHHPEEMEAIAWLEDRPGDPHLLSAPGDEPYSWESPAATLTGIPTVVGWSHEEKHRGEVVYGERRYDVDRMYIDDWEYAGPLLAAYDVTHVYVGPLERDEYGTSIRAFGERPELSIAFENDAVTIYAVDRDAIEERYGDDAHDVSEGRGLGGTG